MNDIPPSILGASAALLDPSKIYSHDHCKECRKPFTGGEYDRVCPDCRQTVAPPPSSRRVSLDEMKLAVAKMLPDAVIPVQGHQGDWWFRWKSATEHGILETEWLHVCWLAEQTLGGKFAPYQEWLSSIIRDIRPRVFLWGAAAEHRLEALCRVKHPEMFLS